MKKSKIITLEERNNKSLNTIVDCYESIFAGRCDIEDIKKLADKIAIWYELKYPDYEVTKILHTGEQEKKDINKIMFKDNPYSIEMTSGMGNEWNKWTTNVLSTLEWNEFYNLEAFINSLPFKEAFLLYEAKYDNIVYVNPTTRSAHLHLNKNGTIAIAENISLWTRNNIKDNDIEGMDIKDAVKLIKEKGYELPNNNELESAINRVEKQNKIKEEIFNCAMYKILERGGTRIGPRRAFLFAQEMGLNIDVPLIYGIDYSDPGLRAFVNEYIKAGGHTDLECYNDYRFHKDEKMFETTTIGHILKTKGNDCANFYTDEEKSLHTLLCNYLAQKRENDGYRSKIDELNAKLNEIIVNFFPEEGEWYSSCFKKPKTFIGDSLPCNLRDNEWIADYMIIRYELISEYREYIIEFLNNSELFKQLRHEYELRIVQWQIEYMLNDGENWIIDNEYGGELYIFNPNCDKAFRKGIVDTLTAIGMDKEVIEEGIEKYRHLWHEVYTRLAFKNLYCCDGVEYYNFETSLEEHYEKWLKIRMLDYYLEHKESVDKYGGIAPGYYIDPVDEVQLRIWLGEQHEKRRNYIEEFRKNVEENLVPICTGTDCTGTDKPMKKVFNFFKKKEKQKNTDKDN